jgi:hypothetical protein
MDMARRKIQLAIITRKLLETNELVREQEELVAFIRTKGSDAEVSDRILSTFRATASMLASHKELLVREINTEATELIPGSSVFAWLLKCWPHRLNPWILFVKQRL